LTTLSVDTKFWLEPVRLERSGGFSGREFRVIQRIVEEHQSDVLKSWHDYLSD